MWETFNERMLKSNKFKLAIKHTSLPLLVLTTGITSRGKWIILHFLIFPNQFWMFFFLKSVLCSEPFITDMTPGVIGFIVLLETYVKAGLNVSVIPLDLKVFYLTSLF